MSVLHPQSQGVCHGQLHSVRFLCAIAEQKRFRRRQDHALRRLRLSVWRHLLWDTVPHGGRAVEEDFDSGNVDRFRGGRWIGRGGARSNRHGDVDDEQGDADGASRRPAGRQINHLITTIRNENAAGQDAFVLANMKRRPELQGMPFVMGAACRQDRVKAVSFQTSVSAVRDGLEMDSSRFAARDTTSDPHGPFWQTYMASTAHQGIATDHGIAALTQILAPERKTMRASLLERLKQSNRPEATRAIARSAIFDSDGDIRAAAVKALKDRPRAEYDEVLMHGLRYPLATVAKRSAQVMLALNRTDLLPNVAAVLDEAAPGDPAVQKVEGKPVHVVHELVRINHHRNCLLCHPPSQTGETFEVPGVIPIPGMAFPTSPKDAYGSAQSLGEPMVRADTTYLRQDFSVLMPVTGAAPWPEMQRFDFLVRTRVVEGKELAALQANIQARAADFLSDNHKAALKVLRDLSGEDAAPNAAAWQKVLAAKFQAPR
jgi:hypothetical protein